MAAALAAMTLGLALTGCSNSGGADDNTIVVGLDVGFAPMGFEQDGEIVGFDIDLARAVIEDKMGMTVQFQPIDWDSKEGGAEHRQDRPDLERPEPLSGTGRTDGPHQFLFEE